MKNKFVPLIILIVSLFSGLICCESKHSSDNSENAEQNNSTEENEWERMISSSPKIPEEGVDSVACRLTNSVTEATILKQKIFFYAESDTAIGLWPIRNRSTYVIEIDTILYSLPYKHYVGTDIIPPGGVVAFWGFFKFDEPQENLVDTVKIYFKRVHEPLTLILEANVAERENH